MSSPTEKVKTLWGQPQSCFFPPRSLTNVSIWALGSLATFPEEDLVIAAVVQDVALMAGKHGLLEGVPRGHLLQRHLARRVGHLRGKAFATSVAVASLLLF